MARQQRSKVGNKAKARQNMRHKAKYERQRIRTEANKRRRCRRHLEKCPNDLQAHNLLGNV